MRRTVAVVLVVVLALAGVGVAVLTLTGGDEDQRSSPEPTPTPTSAAPAPPSPGATRPPSDELRRFYDQRVRWRPCRGEFDCTTVTVPLDYARPGGDTLDLALLRAPAAAPRQRVGSLVVNPGGPGAPGTSYAAQSRLVFRDPLLDSFDIVGFDPRGTGASSPVDCLSDTELDAYLAADPSPDDAAERRSFRRDVLGFGAGCAAKSGELAAHVSTVEAARDMDVIRAVLGDGKLDYFGASYGTKLGATYAELFPKRVGRLVLDGAVDLSLGFRALSREQAGGFEVALRAYVEDCVDNSDSCPLGGSLDEGLTRISEFIDEVDAAPLPTSGERELAVGNAFYGIVAPLYVRDYWPVLTQALERGFAGDGSLLLQLSDLYTSRGAEGYTDNSAEAIYAINCLDDPASLPFGKVRAAVPVLERVSPTFGSVFAWGLTGCRGFRSESTQPPLDVDGSGADPIVVIGTTRDPATPYAWAKALARQLDSGVLVSRDGDGHTGYNAGNDCVDDAVHAYLLEGTVPDDGLSC